MVAIFIFVTFYDLLSLSKSYPANIRLPSKIVVTQSEKNRLRIRFPLNRLIMSLGERRVPDGRSNI